MPLVHATKVEVQDLFQDGAYLGLEARVPSSVAM